MKNEILYGQDDDTHILKLVGDIRLHTSKPLDDFFRAYVQTGQVQELLIDLSETVGLDSTALGLLAQLAIGFVAQTQKKPLLICPSKSIQRILAAVHFEELLLIIHEPETLESQLHNLPANQTESEQEIAQRALKAHRILCSLNENNKQQFKTVVAFLEADLKKK